MSNEYFKLTPVSEKPEKEGWYVVLNQDATFQLYFKGTTWMMAPYLPEHHHPDFDSWLRPVSLPVQDGEEVDGFDKYYQPLFDLLHHEHNLLPLASEMNDIIDVVNKMQTNAEIKAITESTPTPTVTTQVEGIIEAAKDLLNSKFWQYKAGNGRMISVEDSSGEKCWIVPDEKIQRLQDAVEQPASLPAAGGSGEDDKKDWKRGSLSKNNAIK